MTEYVSPVLNSLFWFEHVGDLSKKLSLKQVYTVFLLIFTIIITEM